MAFQFRTHRWLVRIILLPLAVISTPAIADSDSDSLWPHCGASFVPSEFGSSRPVADTGGETRISADEVMVRQQEYFQLKGKVQLQKNAHFLSADQANYHRGEDFVEALGSVRFETNAFLISGTEAKLNLKKNQGEILSSKFWLPQSHMRGDADSIRLRDADSMTLKNASFTSCNENDEVWKLKASELSLNRAKNQAIVYHARLEFLNTPVLYFPYLNLPIEGRKTGLLIPNFGYSNESGSEYAQPFYWNIAPNQDATFTAHYFSKRGLQANGEYRFLQPTSKGQVNLEYLPNDAISGVDRSYIDMDQSWVQRPFDPEWTAAINYRRASDEDYLKDFGGSLNLSSLSYLERIASVHYRKNGWRLSGLAQHFQILDRNISEDSKPTQRLPQFQLETPLFSLAGLEYGLQSEWVRFDRSSGLTGRRADVNAYFQLPMTSTYGFMKPKIGIRHTRYDLTNNLAGSDSTPSRTIPTVSLDNGLFFERRTKVWGKNMTQTLEPRLYYLYVPYRDQSGLLVDESGTEKVFDSSPTRLDFAQLFRDNRFMGLDRIGDTNQLSLALTSRFLSPSGREVFSASAGQIRYFRDRRVTLPGSTVQTKNRSDTLISVYSEMDNANRLQAEFVWDDQASSTLRSTVKYQFLPQENKSISLAYRYEKQIIEQADFKLLLPLENRWKFVALWNYSLMDDLTLENMQGLEYESCCWALRLVRRETIEDLVSKSYNDSLLVQFELKGLASVGGKAAAFFERGTE